MNYSVCIPIFNQDATALASALSMQSDKLDQKWEVIFLDDASQEQYISLNQSLSNLPNVSFHQSSVNLGRSGARNRLAELAQGEFLIFLDGDSLIMQEDFLEKYSKSQGELIVGGRLYPEEVNPKSILHWRYGVEKESKSAKQRAEKPYSNFHSNNFLIAKDLFLKLKFDERISTYGHEDTLFGFQLEKEGLAIKHIDNPVLHGILESNEEFLAKSELGIQNLLMIYQLEKDIVSKSALLASHVKLKRMGLNGVGRLWFRLFAGPMKRNLLGSNPSLSTFNLYKLGYLCSIS